MIRDPKGNELRLVLLQVMDRDARGPLTLRVRQDDEQIGLVSDPNPTFYMVWAATTSGLAETQLSDIVTELTSVKERQELVEKERLLLSRDVSRVTRELTTLETECAQKTEALRVLQKERDPEHVDRLVKDAVAHATKGLDDELRAARAREQRLGDQVTELQAAKKSYVRPSTARRQPGDQDGDNTERAHARSAASRHRSTVGVDRGVVAVGGVRDLRSRASRLGPGDRSHRWAFLESTCDVAADAGGSLLARA